MSGDSRSGAGAGAGRGEREGGDDLLPDVTRDELAESWGEEAGDDRDDELRREVPPHHG